MTTYEYPAFKDKIENKEFIFDWALAVDAEGEIAEWYWDQFIKKVGDDSACYEWVSHGRGSAEDYIMFFKRHELLSNVNWITTMDMYAIDQMKAKPYVIYMYGEAGSGKSVNATNYGTPNNTYIKGVTDKWWDGYLKKHEVVILDDLGWEDVNGRDAPFKDTFMKRLLDRWPLRVERKGGSVVFNAKTIIITSAKKPQDIFTDENDPNRWAQIERRIDEIWMFEGKYKGMTPKPKTILVKDGNVSRVNKNMWTKLNDSYKAPEDRKLPIWLETAGQKLPSVKQGGQAGLVHHLLVKGEEIGKPGTVTYPFFNGRFLISDDRYTDFINVYSAEIVRGSIISMLEQPWGWAPKQSLDQAVRNGAGIYLDIDCELVADAKINVAKDFKKMIWSVMQDIRDAWKEAYPDNTANMNFIVAAHEDVLEKPDTGDRGLHIYQLNTDKDKITNETRNVFVDLMNQDGSHLWNWLGDREFGPKQNSKGIEVPRENRVIGMYDANASDHNVAVLFGGKRKGRRYFPYWECTIRGDVVAVYDLNMGMNFENVRDIITITSQRAAGKQPYLPPLLVEEDKIDDYLPDRVVQKPRKKAVKKDDRDAEALAQKAEALAFYKDPANASMTPAERKAIQLQRWPLGQALMDAANVASAHKRNNERSNEKKALLDFLKD